eukprot:1142273-Pelagomonas_calceolata.AAC.1
MVRHDCWGCAQAHHHLNTHRAGNTGADLFLHKATAPAAQTRAAWCAPCPSGAPSGLPAAHFVPKTPAPSHRHLFTSTHAWLHSCLVAPLYRGTCPCQCMHGCTHTQALACANTCTHTQAFVHVTACTLTWMHPDTGTRRHINGKAGIGAGASTRCCCKRTARKAGWQRLSPLKISRITEGTPALLVYTEACCLSTKLHLTTILEQIESARLGAAAMVGAQNFINLVPVLA